jgi:hypothetical protein
MAYANHRFFPEQLEQEFPFWRRLHGFWRTLPNFNPYTASSEPGQDIAADALVLIHGRGQDNNNNGDGFEEDFYGDEDTHNDTDKNNEQVCCQSPLCSM